MTHMWIICANIEESGVALSITKGNGSQVKKTRAKGGADHLEKCLCILYDIAYHADLEDNGYESDSSVDEDTTNNVFVDSGYTLDGDGGGAIDETVVDTMLREVERGEGLV
ncbi:hypothetical protein DVH24_006972 [Malus domestica]|uniref:Uncharacterized protein n=1 Tax=Malus domestica TaxID=3750 RepID=A0A498I9K6_MALDO|nr:hypothetical protein DVH24_006972 [Malus domestica]